MMSYENILYEKRDGIAKITFNRPKVLNALNRKTVEELQNALIDARGDAIGLVNVADLLFEKDKPPSLSRYLRRMVTVQENEAAARAVHRLRAARLGLAAVVDQKRNLIGFVASEDLIARLVRA